MDDPEFETLLAGLPSDEDRRVARELYDEFAARLRRYELAGQVGALLRARLAGGAQ